MRAILRDAREGRRMAKKKVIKKDLLMQVRLSYIKYYNIIGDDLVEDSAWEEWKNACVKAFPCKKNTIEFIKLKDMSRTLKSEPFDTWVKVYQALGYEVK